MKINQDKLLINNLNQVQFIKSHPDETGIFSDIDGTICEIAPTPAEATIKPEMKSILRKLNKKYKVLVAVTGRDIKNAEKLLKIKDLAYVGNHGLEIMENNKIKIRPEVKKYLPQIRKISKELETFFQNEQGILIENKKTSCAVHYRTSKKPKNARQKILAQLKNLPLKIREGKKVVEILPPLEFSKGSIVKEIVHKYVLKNILYLGDDITDIDAFEALKELKIKKGINTFSIGVISDEISLNFIKKADFLLEGVNEVLTFLKWLAKTG